MSQGVLMQGAGQYTSQGTPHESPLFHHRQRRQPMLVVVRITTTARIISLFMLLLRITGGPGGKAHSGRVAVGRMTGKFRLHGTCQMLLPAACCGSVSRGHETIHHVL